MTDATAPFRIVFVCTGNTCRSPLAEALARREVEKRGWRGVEVSSAGVAAMPGGVISGGSLRAAAAVGLDLRSHSARLLDAPLVAEVDVILTMSEHHRLRAIELGGDGKVDLLTRFAGGGPDGVPDPFGSDDATYLHTLEVLDTLVRAALDRLAPVLAP